MQMQCSKLKCCGRNHRADAEPGDCWVFEQLKKPSILFVPDNEDPSRSSRVADQATLSFAKLGA